MPRTLRLACLLLGAALCCVSTAAQSSAFAGIPVTGTLSEPNGGSGTFSGTVDVVGFSFAGGHVYATVSLQGTAITSSGTAVWPPSKTGPLLVIIDGASCDFLDMHLQTIVIGVSAGGEFYQGTLSSPDRPDGIYVPHITATNGSIRRTLCAIASAYARNKVSAIADQLNRLLRQLA